MTIYLLKFLSVILMMALLDVVWIFTMDSVNKGESLNAGLWSAMLTLFLALSTVGYIGDSSFIIAAMIGSFIGGSLTTKYKK